MDHVAVVTEVAAWRAAFLAVLAYVPMHQRDAAADAALAAALRQVPSPARARLPVQAQAQAH